MLRGEAKVFKTHLENQGRGNFRPHTAKVHLLVGEFRGHMQKLGPKPPKTARSKFQNFAVKDESLGLENRDTETLGLI